MLQKLQALTYNRLFPKVSRYLTAEGNTIVSLAYRIRRHHKDTKAVLNTTNKVLMDLYIKSLFNASMLSFDIYGDATINMKDARKGFISLSDGTEFIVLLYSNKHDIITMVYARIHNIETTYSEFITSFSFEELCSNPKELLGIINSVLHYNDIDQIEEKDMTNIVDLLYEY